MAEIGNSEIVGVLVPEEEADDEEAAWPMDVSKGLASLGPLPPLARGVT